MSQEARSITIEPMKTEADLMGKAYVHWKSWHEAYPGLISEAYLAGHTLEKCRQIARRWPDNLLLAKDGQRVIGFVGYGHREDEAPSRGEIFALYVLTEYYGAGVGSQLMAAALARLKTCETVCLWVLKENRRAIRFYEKQGFFPDGETLYSPILDATEIRMVRSRR